MQICMKLNENDARALGLQLTLAREEQGWSLADLSRFSGVEASQVSKICAGKFRFINASVMQICTVLNVRPRQVAALPPADTPLVKEVTAAWTAARPSAVLLSELLDRLARARG
jgi:transcriptional regulator with XRE-family HTH domain